MQRPQFRGNNTVIFQGQTYQIGQGFLEPLPLPDWLPTTFPPGRAAIDTTGWTDGPDPAYARAYTKYGNTKVLISCARYGDGKRWLHVSVSRRNQEIPSWQCMREVKELFIGTERTALQVMPPRAKHVSLHNGCLHLWCSLDGDVLPDFTCGGETI